MPIPADIVRVQLVKTITGQNEIVTNTLHLKRNHNEPNVTDWPANTQEIANKFIQKYIASGLIASLSSVNTILKAKAYHLDVNGKTLHKAEAFTAGGQNGTGATAPGNALPFDVSCVVSLRTDQPGDFFPDPDVGPSPTKRSRGRIYEGVLPVSAMSGNGRFATAWLTDLRDRWVTFLNDLSEMTVGGGANPDTVVPVILSKAGNQAREITEVVVDDLPDTQQRRSNRQAPNRLRAFTDMRDA